MSPVLGHHELDTGVTAQFRGLKYGRRDKGIILSLQDKGGDADPVEEADGGLRPVVVSAVLEAERGGGDPLVDVADGAEAPELRCGETSGAAEAAAHAADEAALVKVVVEAGEAIDRAAQVERGGDGANPCDQRLGRLSQLPRQL